MILKVDLPRAGCGSAELVDAMAMTGGSSCPIMRDWDDLLTTIRETEAKKILVTHGASYSLVKYLNDHQVDAEPLSTFFGGSEDDAHS